MSRYRLAVGILAFALMVTSVACMLLPFYPLLDRTRQSLVIEPDKLPSARKGDEYEAEIVVSQAETPVIDFYILEGTLPDGLSMEHVEHENAAKITGIPMEAGTFTFTISVQCYGTNVSGQSSSKEYTIVVGD
jgi:hypothetical protein